MNNKSEQPQNAALKEELDGIREEQKRLEKAINSDKYEAKNDFWMNKLRTTAFWLFGTAAVFNFVGSVYTTPKRFAEIEGRQEIYEQNINNSVGEKERDSLLSFGQNEQQIVRKILDRKKADDESVQKLRDLLRLLEQWIEKMRLKKFAGQVITGEDRTELFKILDELSIIINSSVKVIKMGEKDKQIC